jgi:hypothetical protein
VTVSANPVVDGEGSGVQYRFFNTTLSTDSGWLSSPTWTNTGLTQVTTYSYTVQSRDTSAGLNESAVSSPESATTLSSAFIGNVATWGFADQGATANANLSASNIADGASAGDLVVGSGYVAGGQVVSGTFYTYTDSAQNSGAWTKSDGSGFATGDEFYLVGDWNDGSPGGGNLDDGPFANNQWVNPNALPGGATGSAGRLILSSSGSAKTTLAGAISNNLGVTFSVTASGADIEFTGFSFHGLRINDGSGRSWVTWYLQADTGSGFNTIYTSAAGSIATVSSGTTSPSTWDLEAADPFSLSIADGETATFRLIGTSTDSSSFGRSVHLDELTLKGIVSPVASSAYSTWAGTNAPTTGNDPTADEDGDGVSNGLECVLGGSISTNDLGKLPTVGTTPGGDMTFTFRRDRTSKDGSAVPSIEVSADLGDWSTSFSVPDTGTGGVVNPGVTVVENSPSGFDTVTLTVPKSPDARKFARLKVTIGP